MNLSDESEVPCGWVGVERARTPSPVRARRESAPGPRPQGSRGACIPHRPAIPRAAAAGSPSSSHSADRL